MRYANWLVAAITGASLTLLTASGMAQIRTGVKDPDVPKGGALGTTLKGKALGTTEDVPKGKALGVDPDADVPRKKGPGEGRDPANTDDAVRRAAAADRRETRRIPVIDANAGGTFRSTQLVGTTITDADGKAIGKVVDFVSDARGNILYDIVSFSGLPGFTGKLFAIPPAGLTFAAGENNTTTAQFAFDPTLLKNAPSFTSLRFPDFSDPAFLSDLNTFNATLLESGASRTTAIDATVPANGPGDRPQTQAQANTPTRPVDPTLPANGPGDRPATVNPALPATGTAPATTTPSSKIPGTTGTENAGFPPLAGTRTTPGTNATSGTTTGEADLSSSIASTRTAATKEARNAAAGNNRMMLRSSQMLGMSIVDNKGQNIGKVVDFVGDTGGNSQFAVVSLGSDQMIILPFHALHFQTGANGTSFVSLRVAPGQLKNAPSFTGNQWPNFMDSKFTNQVSTFYSDLLPTPGASRGYDYGQFPTTSPDGTKFPRGVAPGTSPAPGATAPGTPRPGAGPRLPAPGSGAPGVPGVPGLPGGKVGGPGAAPGTPAPGSGAPGGSGSGPVKTPRGGGL